MSNDGMTKECRMTKPEEGHSSFVLVILSSFVLRHSTFSIPQPFMEN